MLGRGDVTEDQKAEAQQGLDFYISTRARTKRRRNGLAGSSPRLGTPLVLNATGSGGEHGPGSGGYCAAGRSGAGAVFDRILRQGYTDKIDGRHGGRASGATRLIPVWIENLADEELPTCCAVRPIKLFGIPAAEASQGCWPTSRATMAKTALRCFLAQPISKNREKTEDQGRGCPVLTGPPYGTSRRATPTSPAGTAC